CPVAHTDAFNGFWLLTKHADITQVLRSWKTYVTSVQNVVPKVAFTGRRPPLHLDPPEHTPYRRALNPFFTKEKVEAMVPLVRACVVDLLTPLIDAGDVDFCVDFAHPLPGAVLAHFFNLPVETGMEIREITKGYTAALNNASDDVVKKASLDLYEVARRMIEERKARPLDPNDDPTTAMLQATWNGEPLPEAMVLGTVRQFIVVGMVAPIVFLGSVAIHLSEHPEIHAQLRDDPRLIPAAVQEYLRLFTPYRGFARTANRDVEIGGRTIHKDEPIALAYASANRDEDVFPDPDEFILHRPNIAKHVAFGGGPHRCAGAPLASEIIRITLEELVTRCWRIEARGDVTMSGWPEIGTLSVPVRLHSE
ncbi:MAG: cytochrome P450, partial [Solirubrobacteraceae bacterium]